MKPSLQVTNGVELEELPGHGWRPVNQAALRPRRPGHVRSPDPLRGRLGDAGPGEDKQRIWVATVVGSVLASVPAAVSPRHPCGTP